LKKTEKQEKNIEKKLFKKPLKEKQKLSRNHPPKNPLRKP